jgi:hypothetical protein
MGFSKSQDVASAALTAGQYGPGVTLQVNVAPPDFPHAREVLPHQLRQWGRQVDEVLFTLEVRRSPGRHRHGWDDHRHNMERLLSELCEAHPNARVEPVDYSPRARAAVSRRFFGGAAVPIKDQYGTPFYGYFFGLLSSRHRFVLHTDSDMLFGGGGQAWTAEASRLLAARREVFTCSPLPGPPTPDGRIPPHVAVRHVLGSTAENGLGPRPYKTDVGGPAFAFPAMSSRLFMIDCLALGGGGVVLSAASTDLRRSILALIEGHPRYQVAEAAVSRAMVERGLVRVDFLGTSPGMWSIHPPYRSAAFYRALPDLVRRIEQGDVPEAQRGDYDINDSMVDWSSARAERRRARWRKLLRR